MFEGIGLRLIWYIALSVGISYACYLVLVNQVLAQASGELQPIKLVDQIKPGVHYISGMINVEHNCDQLNVRVTRLDESTYQLKFETWEEPSVRCTSDPVPRHFTTTAFAPGAGIHFIATLNGSTMPIILEQRILRGNPPPIEDERVLR